MAGTGETTARLCFLPTGAQSRQADLTGDQGTHKGTAGRGEGTVGTRYGSLERV